MRRRGIRPEAIRNFIVSTGVTQNDITVPVDALYFENKKIVDPVANRYFFIQKPVMLKIAYSPKRKIKLHLHPQDTERGDRTFEVSDEFFVEKQDFDSFEDGKIYRLMDCLNFKKHKDKFEFDSFDYETYKQKGEKIMHWLPASGNLDSGNLDVGIFMPDGKIISGIAEQNISKVKPDEVVQFERFGFCRFDGKKGEKYLFWFSHK